MDIEKRPQNGVFLIENWHLTDRLVYKSIFQTIIFLLPYVFVRLAIKPLYTLKLAWGRNLNKPSLMPPWWVYKNHGERSDLRLALFLFVLSCNGFDLCGVSVRLLAITLSRLLLPWSLILSGACYRTARRGRA